MLYLSKLYQLQTKPVLWKCGGWDVRQTTWQMLKPYEIMKSLECVWKVTDVPSGASIYHPFNSWKQVCFLPMHAQFVVSIVCSPYTPSTYSVSSGCKGPRVDIGELLEFEVWGVDQDLIPCVSIEGWVNNPYVYGLLDCPL